MKNSVRVSAMVLALLMVLSAMPLSVFAEGFEAVGDWIGGDTIVMEEVAEGEPPGEDAVVAAQPVALAPVEDEPGDELGVITVPERMGDEEPGLIALVPVELNAASPAWNGTVTDSAVNAALSAAGTFAGNIIPSVNSISSTVSTWQTQFSWDNEKRESGKKSYLFEWSYYNGVVFEGIHDLYLATEDTSYRDKVSAYYAAMINGNTSSWKNCTNDTSKQAAGYVNYHGVDCYKTASLLLDYGYTAMAATLYNDLKSAETNTSWCPNPANYGYNYRHTWTSAPSYYVWLDGLYMVQPFMAKYAAYTNDTAELSKIASRFEWIGNNMYNSANGLYYHAANSASDHPSGYWLRAVGWYAAAMADVIPYLSGSDQTALIAQLKKLVDGMLPYQDPSTGMWHNYIDQTGTTGANRLESSGTALLAYAILKAVNEGWLNDSYAVYGEAAFIGICSNKLSATTLTDTCVKGSPGNTGTNSTFADNEGKGVGPFLLAYAELIKYTAAPRVTLSSVTVDAEACSLFRAGSTFSAEGLTVTANYSDGTSETVTDYSVNSSSVNMSAAGSYTVTVTYGDVSASYTVVVWDDSALAAALAAGRNYVAAPGVTVTTADVSSLRDYSDLNLTNLRAVYDLTGNGPAIMLLALPVNARGVSVWHYTNAHAEPVGVSVTAINSALYAVFETTSYSDYIIGYALSQTDIADAVPGPITVDETNTDTNTETKTIYVLTDTLTAGKKYVIATRNTTGTATVLGHDGETVNATTAAVKAASTLTTAPTGTTVTVTPSVTDPYMDVVDASAVWTARTTSSDADGVALVNAGSYLRAYSITFIFTSYTFEASDYDDTGWHYSGSRLVGESDTYPRHTHYLRYTGSEWTISTASGSATDVYLYEEKTVSVVSETVTGGLATYALNCASIEASDRATEALISHNTTKDGASYPAQYSFGYENNAVISSIDEYGTAVLTGAAGSVPVRVYSTFTDGNDASHTIYKDITVTVTQSPRTVSILNSSHADPGDELTVPNVLEGDTYTLEYDVRVNGVSYTGTAGSVTFSILEGTAASVSGTTLTFTGETGSVLVQAAWNFGTGYAYDTLVVNAVAAPRTVAILDKNGADAGEEITVTGVMQGDTYTLGKKVMVGSADRTSVSALTWEQLNGTSVASLSAAGVLTFTGKSGTVEVKLTYTYVVNERTYILTDVVAVSVTAAGWAIHVLDKDGVNRDPEGSDTFTLTFMHGQLAVPYQLGVEVLKDGVALTAPEVEWTVTENEILTMNGTGRLTFTGEFGVAVVTVSYTYSVAGEDVTISDTVTVAVEDSELEIFVLKYDGTDAGSSITVNGVDQTTRYQLGMKLTQDGELYAEYDEAQITWTSANTSVATVDASGRVSFTGTAGSAEITVKYTYLTAAGITRVIGDSVTFTVTAASPSTETTTVTVTESGGSIQETWYIFTDTVTNGKKYVISNIGQAGNGYALSHTNANVKNDDAITVNNGIRGVPSAGGSNGEYFIRSSEVESTSIWTASSYSSNWRFNNGSYYLYRSNSNSSPTLQFSTSTTRANWTWNGNAHTLQNNRYLRYNNGWELTGSSSNVYLYEETVVSVPTTASFTYAITASDLTKTEVTSAATGTIATSVTKTKSDNTSATAPAGTYTYELVNDGDGIISSIGADGTLYFSGNSGTARVKVTFTFTDGNGVTRSICDTAKVTARGKLTLSVSPKTATLVYTAAGTTLQLTASWLDTELRPAGSYLRWETSDANAVSVNTYTGLVTVTGEGTATITAKLCAEDGTVISSDTAVITAVRPVASFSYIGGPVYVNKGGMPDFSNISLRLVYEDGGYVDIPYARLSFDTTGLDTSSPGSFAAAASVSGSSGFDGTVTVIVLERNDYSGYDPAESYAEYPEPGAVRIDKSACYEETSFEETGVTRVELDVAGISKPSIVDVVLIVDISNSMGWSMENASNPNNTDDASRAASEGQNSKLDDAMEAASDFAEALCGDNDLNTLTFVTFAGYQYDWSDKRKDNAYTSSVYTVFSACKNVDQMKTAFGNTKIKYDGDAAGKFVFQIGNLDGSYLVGPYNVTGSTVGVISAHTPTNRGDTNYDYAFYQANSAIDGIIASFGGAEAYDAAGRQIAVVFMTDGAASHYRNIDGTAASRSSRCQNDYLPGTTTDYGTQQDTSTWYTNFLMQGANYYASQVFPRATAGFYSVGFDLAHGGFNTTIYSEEQLVAFLQQMIDDEDYAENNVFPATDTDELNAVFNSLARNIKMAGTEAEVYDIIDSDYTLQLGSTITGTTATGSHTVDLAGDFGFTPNITVKKYELYSAADVGTTGHFVTGTAEREVTSADVGKTAYFAEGRDGKLIPREVTAADVGSNAEFNDVVSRPVTADDVGVRKRDEDGWELFTEIETVTLSEDGSGNLVATSDKVAPVEGAAPNIYSVASNGDVSISARYFDYHNYAGVESFTWNIGDIPDAEIALSYYAYLKGAQDGERDKGAYYTNERATLDYVDIEGNYASQTFPMPILVWGGATTNVRFYYVDAHGYPVNSRGASIDAIENRVFAGDTVTINLNLNQGDEYWAAEIKAFAYLPAGFTLYDPDASYTVTTSSVNGGGGVVLGYSPRVVLDDSGNATFTDSTHTEYVYYTQGNNTTLLAMDTKNHVITTVDFAILKTDVALYNLANDRVVVDYGKPITVDVAANDMEGISQEASGWLSPFDPQLVALLPNNPNWVAVEDDPDSIDFNAKLTGASYEAQKTMAGKYGTFRLAGTAGSYTGVTYTAGTMLSGPDEVFCVFKMNNGQRDGLFYLCTRLTVIPATNVYYETDFVPYETLGPVGEEPAVKYNGTFTLNNAFTVVGTAGTGNQDYAKVGAEGVTYGYDSGYADKIGDLYSNGSAVKVNNTTGKPMTDAVKFTFTGTGFDLFSCTDANQGTIRVTVTDKDGTAVRTVSVLNKSDGNLSLYQIPVVSIDSLTYGTYDVSVTVYHAYTNAAYPALNRGGEFLFDAVRVYDPAKGNRVAEAAYAADHELNPQYFEVRNLILSAEAFDAMDPSGAQGAVFVDYSYPEDPDDPNANKVTEISDYLSIGPNNETYLQKGQAIAFRYAAGANGGIDLGVKTVEQGKSVSVTVYVIRKDQDGDGVVVKKDFTVASGTEQFYTVGNAGVVHDGDLIMIMNASKSDGVLSITNMKVVDPVGTIYAMVTPDVIETVSEVLEMEDRGASYAGSAQSEELPTAPDAELPPVTLPVMELLPVAEPLYGIEILTETRN